MLGKAAAKRGLTVIAPYYPLHPLTEMDLPAPMHWALAIARRESEFNADVTSGAGASGLMQLMPATAREMAAKTAMPWQPARLTGDWRYNARLGAAYLAELIARYDGNPLLVAAAYNAGPGRVAGWLETYGDPRLLEAQAVIDWIEHLPFRETRNYVMRATESLPVYAPASVRRRCHGPFLHGRACQPASDRRRCHGPFHKSYVRTFDVACPRSSKPVPVFEQHALERVLPAQRGDPVGLELKPV